MTFKIEPINYQTDFYVCTTKFQYTVYCMNVSVVLVV